MAEHDVEQLEALAARLGVLLENAPTNPEDAVGRTACAAEKVAKAWSGSSFGYHANVYYANLEPPPPGAHFSSEWGFYRSMLHGTSGEWREYGHEQVVEHTRKMASAPDLTEGLEWAKQPEEMLGRGQNLLTSIVSAATARNPDVYLEKVQKEASKLRIVSTGAAGRGFLPTGRLMSRDSLALSQGLRVAPHQAILAEVIHIESAAQEVKKLRELCEYASGHLARSDPGAAEKQNKTSGRKVFIGHGRSPEWRKLKDFLQDRLMLPWDEFNRIPVAGQTNIARLSSMLDEAIISFMVMTAEDEMADGQQRARENVVHEVGLFQGRLGFGRAIVLIEEDCNEFSNIHGLGQIRFPKGNVEAAFEEVRRVLEREGIIPPSGT